ncbi:MAG TPA: hypothetical protein PLV56_10165 [Synergistales bacterium]|nr:hypothetical protein [Synergistales bacterium]
MDKHKIKLFLEKGSFNVGCVGPKYSAEELESLPQGRNLAQIGEILNHIREKYGDRVEVSIIDPRSIISIIDNIRYNIKSSKPTWVLDGKKIFEEIPSWEELESRIDSVIAA